MLQTRPLSSLAHSTRPSTSSRRIARTVVQRNIQWTGNRSIVVMRSLLNEDSSTEDLKRQLDEAIENEDYLKAAKLRDELSKRMMDNRIAVEDANERFYRAFMSGRLDDMKAVWGKGEHVQCIHPGGGCIAGHDMVMESWRWVLGNGRLKIQLEDVRIFATDTTGFVTCVEVVDASDSKGRILATNVFEKQNGRWKIVHHHASAPPM